VPKFWSILFGGTMGAAFLLFVVSPFVGWWLPPNVASFGGDIDGLFYLILGITGFFFVLTEAVLVYALWKYAGQPGRKASYVHGNHKLEVVWTIVPAVILLLLGIVQINVWADVKFKSRMPKPDGDTQQMEVIARQWEWRVRYPSSKDIKETWKQDPKKAEAFGRNPSVDDVHVPNEIHVYKGGKVLVHLKTQDVIHSFFLPNLRLKQDALPGKTIPVWFEVNDSQGGKHNVERDALTGRWLEIGGINPATGRANKPENTWELACAEFCGARHSMMRGKLYVHESKKDFLDWLEQTEKEQNAHAPTK
jgi:cytochrome c oxidase subunit 2